jgi:4-hydroxy-tetrahydrodipicolinate synthase
VRFAVSKAAGRVPVIAGAGSNDTRHGAGLCKACQTAGADALLLVTPYYNKATQNGLVGHFAQMAKASDLPIMVYNVPGRTALNILPETMKKLTDIDTIVATKEASGDMHQVGLIKQLCGDRFDIYSGNDNSIVPLLSLGGKGVVSVLANVAPRDVHDMVMNYLGGRLDEALKLQLKALPLDKALFSEVSPVPVKEALNMMGFGVGRCRMPLAEIEDGNRILLENAMKAYGLI